MIELVTTWLVGAMISWVPPRHDADRVRYESIARDLATVVYDDAEQPIFAGDAGRYLVADCAHAAALQSFAVHAVTSRAEVV